MVENWEFPLSKLEKVEIFFCEDNMNGLHNWLKPSIATAERNHSNATGNHCGILPSKLALLWCVNMTKSTQILKGQWSSEWYFRNLHATLLIYAFVLHLYHEWSKIIYETKKNVANYFKNFPIFCIQHSIILSYFRKHSPVNNNIFSNHASIKFYIIWSGIC